MTAKTNSSPEAERGELLAAVLDQLACPGCLGSLRRVGSDLACAACGRIYPIVEGIPVLIAETPSRSI